MADSDNYEDGCVLWVTSQDVKSSYLDRTTTQLTEKGAKKLTLYPAGSLVMVTRSGILRHTLPVAELRKPSTVNQDIRVILPQDTCCGGWLLQFFISRNKELLLEFGKTGTTVESVDFGKIKDMLLCMPSSVEQQQIGRYFAQLDSLITLHQRKYDKLCTVKKSMLDKMFPKPGETEPEMRFEGFTDPWEQRKLGECIDSFSTGPNILGSYSNDGDYLVKMGNMRRGEFVLDRIERLPKGFAINSEDYLAPGDFLFNTRNTFEMAGKGATWRIGQGKYTFNSNIARIRFSCLDSYFMNYLYNTEQVIEQVRARVTGTTSVAAVYLDSLNTVQIAFPELGEQRRIGTFFTDLDSLITLHQRKLELLGNIKKSLLDRMFV